VGALALLMATLAWAANPSQARPRGDTGVRDASGGTGAAQTEQTIAVDPTNPKNVLIGFINGTSISHDGGLTWKPSSVSCGGDNNPMFDRRGVAYFECDGNGVQVYRSDDGGRTWDSPIAAVSQTDNQGDLVDRPWIVRAPNDRRVVLGWESFFTNPVGWVFVKSSYDGGRTWSAAHRVDDLTGSPAEQDPREMPVVGADGTIYVVYASGHNPFPAGQVLPTSFVVARSHDDGATFQRVVAATNIQRSRSPMEEAEAISSLAADPSPRRARHLALAWADQRSGESRILVATSVDGGIHWSAPVDIAGDPPGIGNQHDHPQIAFAPDGRLIIVWRDRRGTDGTWTSAYQLFARALTLSSRGRLSFGRVATITAKPQQPNSSTMFDEYLGIAVGRDGLSVAWNQPKNGVATTYYRRIALTSL
jgi:hypothetical protein